MGIDLLDLTFRIEREFQIKLDCESQFQPMETDVVKKLPNGRLDIRVGDFVNWVAATVKAQNPACDKDVFAGVKQQIIDCLGVRESDVTLDAWLIRDLGMD